MKGYSHKNRYICAPNAEKSKLLNLKKQLYNRNV